VAEPVRSPEPAVRSPKPDVRSPLGLYVHVPFCSAICNYCNFNRVLFDADLKQQYVAALLREIREAADGCEADSLFFGGGTPSLLEPLEIERVVEACRNAFALAGDAEVTLEANPETVTPERLAGFRAAGVNRLSYGVQSFRDEELRRLTRLHSAARAGEAFDMARAAGFDNISLDLMMWLPGQSVRQWRESVEALIGLGPDHASLYMLEIYPNAPLRDAMARSAWSVAPDDDVADMYTQAMERLDRAGYVQYEISNVTRPGRESRHNLKYWRDGEWRGFGPGAHSTRAGVRWKNVSGVEEYVSSVTVGGQLILDRRVLSDEERLEDALFTGLRLSRGLDLALVESRYGVDIWARYGRVLQPFVDEGLLIYDCAGDGAGDGADDGADDVADGGGLRLTRAGMLLAHEVMAVFIGSTVR
jgi:oxygen-independent coproporphyrinogen-3 oxidase